MNPGFWSFKESPRRGSKEYQVIETLEAQREEILARMQGLKMSVAKESASESGSDFSEQSYSTERDIRDLEMDIEDAYDSGHGTHKGKKMTLKEMEKELARLKRERDVQSEGESLDVQLRDLKRQLQMAPAYSDESVRLKQHIAGLEEAIRVEREGQSTAGQARMKEGLPPLEQEIRDLESERKQLNARTGSAFKLQKTPEEAFAQREVDRIDQRIALLRREQHEGPVERRIQEAALDVDSSDSDTSSVSSDESDSEPETESITPSSAASKSVFEDDSDDDLSRSSSVSTVSSTETESDEEDVARQQRDSERQERRQYPESGGETISENEDPLRMPSSANLSRRRGFSARPMSLLVRGLKTRARNPRTGRFMKRY
jgi:hypothetical protein